MVDILHRIGIKAAPQDVFDGITKLDRLSGWWTKDTTGDPKVGGVIHFQFGDRGFFDMKVLELDPGKRVVWEVVEGPKEWIGTNVIWDLKPFENGTTILFKHAGWAKPVEFMHHCSTKWATFLMSLKAMLETDTGTPHPNDYRISLDAD